MRCYEKAIDLRFIVKCGVRQRRGKDGSACGLCPCTANRTANNERLAAYKNLRLDKLSSVTSGAYTQNTITLSDGTTIVYPADLRQVVSADSETAKQALLAEKEFKIASKGGGRATLLFFGGVLAFIGSPIGAFVLFDDGKEKQAIAVGVLGVAALTVGSVALVRYIRRYKKHSNLSSEAAKRAIRNYNKDLLSQLNLCFDDKKIVFACENKP
jgi:Flp pilus assembly secretin CpaC